MSRKYPGLRKWCEIAAKDHGFTHLLAADGTKTLLQDVIDGKLRTPSAPPGCFWAGNGASSEFQVALFSNNQNGKRLGFYKFTKEPQEPEYLKVEGEGAPQYTFAPADDQQLALL